MGTTLRTFTHSTLAERAGCTATQFGAVLPNIQPIAVASPLSRGRHPAESGEQHAFVCSF
jgi:hypothetical protein